MVSVLVALFVIILLFLGFAGVSSVIEVKVAKKSDEEKNIDHKGPHYVGPYGYYYHHIPESVAFFFFGVALWGLSILNPLIFPVVIVVIMVCNTILAFFPKLARKVLAVLRIFQKKEYVPDPGRS